MKLTQAGFVLQSEYSFRQLVASHARHSGLVLVDPLEEAVPDEPLPEEGTPDEMLPEEGLPEDVLPDETLPDDELPDALPPASTE